MNFKQQLQKDRKDAFETWYQRYTTRVNLKQLMRISAKKGFTRTHINCLEGSDVDTRRMCSVEFLKRLWEDFPDLDISREHGSEPGFIRSQRYNRIVICWGESEWIHWN
ncbi:hypothetical protein [Listeria booriae]|uniref:hypothetical protein n=1 Tax=Listeria booriae TaxID=1552123 RepID=UPI001625F204|nr:hypothetical protein [Listeria booriae]MBC2174754.1 hypothetical protein [Listeria booriae]